MDAWRHRHEIRAALLQYFKSGKTTALETLRDLVVAMCEVCGRRWAPMSMKARFCQRCAHERKKARKRK